MAQWCVGSHCERFLDTKIVVSRGEAKIWSRVDVAGQFQYDETDLQTKAKNIRVDRRGAYLAGTRGRKHRVSYKGDGCQGNSDSRSASGPRVRFKPTGAFDVCYGNNHAEASDLQPKKKGIHQKQINERTLAEHQTWGEHHRFGS